MTAFSPFGEMSTPVTSLKLFARSAAAVTAASHVICLSFTLSTYVFIAAAVAYLSSKSDQFACRSERPPGARGRVAGRRGLVARRGLSVGGSGRRTLPRR